MKVEFKSSFLKDLKKLKDKHLKNAIADCIVQVEHASDIRQIKNLKKLSGFDEFYRIRIGDYRIGIKISNKTVHFVVAEHRKQVYKGFP